VSGCTTAAHGKDADTLTRDLAALEEERKLLSAQIGKAKQAGANAAPLVAQHRELSKRIGELRAEETDTEQPSGRLATEIVTDPDVFADMQGEWNDLIERSDCYSPFLLWEWLYPWWEVYGEDKELFLVLARRGGRLEGIAPLMVGLRRGRRLDRHTLAFIGTGERAEGDYFDFIVTNRHESEVRRALVHSLLEAALPYDFVDLQQMAVGNGAMKLVEAFSVRGFEVLLTRRRNSVLGPLPDTFDEFVASVPNARRRSYLRNQEDKLTSRFASVEYRSAEDEGGIEELLTALSRYSRNRLGGGKQRSAWEDDRFGACVRRACSMLAMSGRLRLECLRLNESVVAVLMGFAHRGTYFLYQLSFDPKFAAFRPGHCLIAHRIRESIEEGLAGFDFLAGEHEYKTTYSDGRKQITDVTIFRPDPHSLRVVGVRLAGRACRRYVKSVLGR